MFIAILVVGSWQNNLYQIDARAKAGQQQLVCIRSVLPYAIAYLEDNKRRDLLADSINADLGPYALVLTDRAGNIQAAPSSWPPGKEGRALLKGHEFFYLFKNPTSQFSLSGPYTDEPASELPAVAAKAAGRIYWVEKEPQGLEGTLAQFLSPSGTVFTFTLLSYFMVLVGFAGICAITARYQRHYQELQESYFESEMEARGLRIQILESRLQAADLQLELLDRNQERVQTRLRGADDTIAKLQEALQHQSRKKKQVEENLQKALTAKQEALETIEAIELDRERVTKEMKELEALREVEELNYPDPAKGGGRARRPKEFLWLNMVYQNLRFSRRALQDILEVQNSPDIFPSLPDALAALNNTRVEDLKAGEALPSRNVTIYSQPLAHHQGDFWEYRFSRDGRIFFGLSRSRTWNIDTVLLKRNFTENRYKYEKYLEETLAKDNDDLVGPDNPKQD